MFLNSAYLRKVHDEQLYSIAEVILRGVQFCYTSLQDFNLLIFPCDAYNYFLSPTAKFSKTSYIFLLQK